jgi:hypothetical protein
MNSNRLSAKSWSADLLSDGSWSAGCSAQLDEYPIAKERRAAKTIRFLMMRAC